MMMEALAEMGVSAVCQMPATDSEADYMTRVAIDGRRPPWSDVLAVIVIVARRRAMERIELASTSKRATLDGHRAQAHDLKGQLALNAADDTRQKDRDAARALLDAYAKARGESGWKEIAPKIVAARSDWAARVMHLEGLEDMAWRSLQAATTPEQIMQIESAILTAITEV